MSKPISTMSYDDCMKVIERCNTGLAENLKEGSLARVRLQELGRLEHQLVEGPWKFYREIASGRLDVHAALITDPLKHPHLLKFDPDVQTALVLDEKPVPLVVFDAKGNLVEKSFPLSKIKTQRDLTVAFNAQGFRPIKDQRNLRTQEAKDVRRSGSVGKMRWDPQTDELVNGQKRFPLPEVMRLIPLEELLKYLHAPALKKLGYKLVPLPSEGKPAYESRPNA